MRCPYCSTEHPDDAEFCPNTGRSIKGLASATFHCPHCGSEIKKEAQFCPYCGKSLPSFPQGESNFLKKGFFAENGKFKIAGILAAILMIILIVILLVPKSAPSASTRKNNNSSTQTMTTQGLIDYPPASLSPDRTNTPAFTSTRKSFTATRQVIKTSTPPEPERKSCPGAPPIRVEIGDNAQVIDDPKQYTPGHTPLYMRSGPKVGQNVVLFLNGREKLRILDGPVCNNDVAYFKVEEQDKYTVGWINEAVADTNDYLITPIP